jgi:hypothetical protein
MITDKGGGVILHDFMYRYLQSWGQYVKGILHPYNVQATKAERS